MSVLTFEPDCPDYASLLYTPQIFLIMRATTHLMEKQDMFRSLTVALTSTKRLSTIQRGFSFFLPNRPSFISAPNQTFRSKINYYNQLATQAHKSMGQANGSEDEKNCMIGLMQNLKTCLTETDINGLITPKVTRLLTEWNERYQEAESLNGNSNRRWF